MTVNSDVQPFLQRLEKAADLDDLQALIPGLRDTLGVSHVVYHWVSVDGGQFGFGSYDPAWAQRYQEMDYLRVDPVVLSCYRSSLPVDWKRLDWSPRAARGLMQDAGTFGIGPMGLSIPIRGPNGQFAVFTVCSTCSPERWDALIAEREQDLLLLAHYINAHALRIRNERAPEPVSLLSKRESDALSLLSMGYARGHAAERMGISEHTLRTYIESGRRKLGALNTVHAVARALAEGLIVTGGAVRGAEGYWPGQEDVAPDHEGRPVQ